MKDKIITLVLIIIMILNFADVLTDISLDVPIWHIVEEFMISMVAGMVAVYLIFDMRRRTQRLLALRDKLAVTTTQLDTMTEQFKQARHQYFSAVEEQFALWGLTPSEKEVALLMLKGLSTQDIANVRNTKEKTVRQQASSLYSKAGLEGRYALSAWFFEDILMPDNAA